MNPLTDLSQISIGNSKEPRKRSKHDVKLFKGKTQGKGFYNSTLSGIFTPRENTKPGFPRWYITNLFNSLSPSVFM